MIPKLKFLKPSAIKEEKNKRAKSDRTEFHNVKTSESPKQKFERNSYFNCIKTVHFYL